MRLHWFLIWEGAAGLALYLPCGQASAPNVGHVFDHGRRASFLRACLETQQIDVRGFCLKIDALTATTGCGCFSSRVSVGSARCLSTTCSSCWQTSWTRPYRSGICTPTPVLKSVGLGCRKAGSPWLPRQTFA